MLESHPVLWRWWFSDGTDTRPMNTGDTCPSTNVFFWNKWLTHTHVENSRQDGVVELVNGSVCLAVVSLCLSSQTRMLSSYSAKTFRLRALHLIWTKWKMFLPSCLANRWATGQHRCLLLQSATQHWELTSSQSVYFRPVLITTVTTVLYSNPLPALPGWAGTRRNIHPPTILIIIQPLSASSIYHNLFAQTCPRPLLSISWSGALHLIFHTFLHPVSVFFSQHMPIPSQPVLV